MRLQEATCNFFMKKLFTNGALKMRVLNVISYRLGARPQLDISNKQTKFGSSNTERGQDNENRQTVVRIHFRKTNYIVTIAKQYSNIQELMESVDRGGRRLEGKCFDINTARND